MTGRHVAGTPLDIRTVPDATLSRVLHDMEARLPRKVAAVIAPRDTVSVNLDDASCCGGCSLRGMALLARTYTTGRVATVLDPRRISPCGRLAFWTSRDEAQMDQLFRASALMRDKWDTVHGADGATDGQMTIAKAIAGCRMIYGVQPERNELTPRRSMRR